MASCSFFPLFSRARSSRRLVGFTSTFFFGTHHHQYPPPFSDERPQRIRFLLLRFELFFSPGRFCRYAPHPLSLFLSPPPPRETSTRERTRPRRRSSPHSSVRPRLIGLLRWLLSRPRLVGVVYQTFSSSIELLH